MEVLDSQLSIKRWMEQLDFSVCFASSYLSLFWLGRDCSIISAFSCCILSFRPVNVTFSFVQIGKASSFLDQTFFQLVFKVHN